MAVTATNPPTGTPPGILHAGIRAVAIACPGSIFCGRVCYSYCLLPNSRSKPQPRASVHTSEAWPNLPVRKLRHRYRTLDPGVAGRCSWKSEFVGLFIRFCSYRRCRSRAILHIGLQSSERGATKHHATNHPTIIQPTATYRDSISESFFSDFAKWLALAPRIRF